MEKKIAADIGANLTLVQFTLSAFEPAFFFLFWHKVVAGNLPERFSFSVFMI